MADRTKGSGPKRATPPLNPDTIVDREGKLDVREDLAVERPVDGRGVGAFERAAEPPKLPAKPDDLLALVRMRGAHLRHIERAWEGRVLTVAREFIAKHGWEPENAVALAIGELEEKLVERERCADKHHLYAMHHPRRHDPRVQEAFALAGRLGLRGKDAALDALRTVGVEVDEDSLRRDLAAPVHFVDSGEIARLDTEHMRADDDGDDVGRRRAKDRTKQAVDSWHALQRNPDAVEAAPLPQVVAGESEDDGE